MGDQAAALRQRILEVATPLFLARGYSTVTMDEIAAELGISKRTLYQQITSKEQLLAAAVEHFFQQVRQEIEAIVTTADLSFPERLALLLRTIAGRVGRIQGPALADIKRCAPHIWTRMTQLRRTILNDELGQLLASGRAAGMLRPDLPPPLIIGIVLAAVEQLATPEAFERLGYGPVVVLQTVTTVVFEGILTDRARTLYRRPEGGQA